MARSRSSTPAILDPDAILRFLTAHGTSDRRAIARGLGLRDAQRSELRLLLRSLVAEGRISLANGRRYSVGGTLKPVMVLEIIGARFLAKDFGSSFHVWVSQIGVVLIALALELPLAGYRKMWVSNASLSELRVHETGATLYLLNETAYLSNAM